MTLWKNHIKRWVSDACVAEVSFHKPGNVTPLDAFADASIDDFVKSAEAIAPVVAEVDATNIGEIVLSCVQATQAAVGHNTNLGMILLLPPLAAVRKECRLEDGIETVLASLTVTDAVHVYQAIEVASPGGLGEARDQDVSKRPTLNLRDCMKLAADRDLVAAQYRNGFADVLGFGLPLLKSTKEWPTSLAEWRLAYLAVSLMSRFGDSLVERKCGSDMNRRVQKLATELLASGWPVNSFSMAEYQAFDGFLRADGHRRNPGTTADMIAAILFAAFRDGICEFSRTAMTLTFLNRRKL